VAPGQPRVPAATRVVVSPPAESARGARGWAGISPARTRQATLERCRQLLGLPLPPPSPTVESVPALLLRLTGIDIERCQVCGQGRLASVEMLRPTPPVPVRAPDTS